MFQVSLTYPVFLKGIEMRFLLNGFLLIVMLFIASLGPYATAQKPPTSDGREPLIGNPDFTLLIEVKDARKAAIIVKKAGGEVLYDPNLGIGHDIPFLVVNLPAEKVVDEEFIKSLELKSGDPRPSIQSDCGCEEPPDTKQGELSFDSLFVPVEDINLPKLQARVPGEARGKGILVAVIDTGVDASHPVFQDRVIYSSDATQEGRIKLEKLKVFDGKISFQEKSIEVPKRIAGNKEVFVGVFDEMAMGIQFPDFVKTNETQGLDFSRNESVKDKFLIIIGADIPTASPDSKTGKPESESTGADVKKQDAEKKSDEPPKPEESKPTNPPAEEKPAEKPQEKPAENDVEKSPAKPVEKSQESEGKPATAPAAPKPTA